MTTSISNASLSSKSSPSPSSEATRANAKVPEADAHQFASAMTSGDKTPEHGGAGSHSKKHSDQHKDEPSDNEPDKQESSKPVAQEEMPFASLFTGRFDAGAGSQPLKAEAASASEATQPFESLAERLAERILVSESSIQGQEVRIQPSRDILPDTEICLVRGADGLLSAVIHTDNPAAFQTLAAAQHDLRTRLEASEGQPVHVELRSSADDDNDPRRRSRGLDLDSHA